MPADLLGPGGRGARGSAGNYTRPTSVQGRLKSSAKKQKTKKDFMTGLGIGLAALATVASAGAAAPALAASMGLAGVSAGALTGAATTAGLGSGLAAMAASTHAGKEATARRALSMPPNPNAKKEY